MFACFYSLTLIVIHAEFFKSDSDW